MSGAVQNNQIFTVSGTLPTNVTAAEIPLSSSTSTQPGNSGSNVTGVRRRRFKRSSQQPVVDVIVICVALPSLTILGLMLESFTSGNWLETTESRFKVLGVGAALAIVCLALCMYVTSRLGKKFLWVGPQFSSEEGPHYSYYNSQAVDDSNDLPPKYDDVVIFDIPPPSYETIINVEYQQPMSDDAVKYPKDYAIQHI